MVNGSMRFSFQAGIILFPVGSLGEMGAFPYIISLRESLIVRMGAFPYVISLRESLIVRMIYRRILNDLFKMAD